MSVEVLERDGKVYKTVDGDENENFVTKERLEKKQERLTQRLQEIEEEYQDAQEKIQGDKDTVDESIAAIEAYETEHGEPEEGDLSLAEHIEGAAAGEEGPPPKKDKKEKDKKKG